VVYNTPPVCGRHDGERLLEHGQNKERQTSVNIYLELTHRFNDGRLRAVLSSGQAVVLHRLAIMSKDGDWILREDDETLDHVLRVLEPFQARYRFGAPLDRRWLAGGWSAHLEFRQEPLRVRTDFVTRPPRLHVNDLVRLWRNQEDRDLPVVGLRDLAEIKKTDREKDWAVIGELARSMHDPADQILYSRSARDLLALAHAHPGLVANLTVHRPLLARIRAGRNELERALDEERRAAMHANESRLEGYQQAAERWARDWRAVQQEVANLPLREAHRIVVERAEGVLPFSPDPDEEPDDA
jgi:hypothetical protein